jgi:hypothetical protein
MIVKRVGLVVLFFLLPLWTIGAQDSMKEIPIIAQAGNKLYAVSPADGTAAVLVAPRSQQVAIRTINAYALSPDGQYLAYVLERRGEKTSVVTSDLYLLNLVTGNSTIVVPSGGVFDRSIPATYYFQMVYPSWTLDGSRLYYAHRILDVKKQNAVVELQLVYYDVVKNQHHLVARLDPERILENVWVTKVGVVVRQMTRGSEEVDVKLYAFNNSAGKRVVGVSSLPNTVEVDGQMYYSEIDYTGAIIRLANVETGEERDVAAQSFLAWRSLLAGGKSLRIYADYGHDGTHLHVYDGDKKLIQDLVSGQGFQQAIAPDGKTLAFVDGQSGNIQLIDETGAVHELPFEAESIVWGAQETEVYIP